MKKALTKIEKETYHYSNSKRIKGIHKDIYGDVSGLYGDVSGLSGYVTEISIV